MALNGLNGYISNYNAYNIPSATDNSQVRQNSADTIDAKASSEQQQKPEEKKNSLDLTVEVPSRENASIENVAISFGQYDGNSIDLFGDMGLASRDMKQAISGMQKDQLLHEYQYFVGKDLSGQQSNIVAGTEDGVVVRLH
ncbi:MAG: hypothetical protein E7305_09895 [Butyrivibrio sp.]|nr:hypothetical protein [Butyrivibrio sp.]